MKKILVVVLLVSLSGCIVNFDHGVISRDHLSMAKKYQGVYRGHFDGAPRTMVIDIDSSGYAYLGFLGTDGTQLIRGCQGEPGKILSADVSGEKITWMQFQFFRRDCPVDGSYITVAKTKRGFHVAVPKEIRWVRDNSECVRDALSCRNAGFEPTVASWLEGEFR